jgi:hypothetical protein
MLCCTVCRSGSWLIAVATEHAEMRETNTKSLMVDFAKPTTTLDRRREVEAE